MKLFTICGPRLPRCHRHSLRKGTEGVFEPSPITVKDMGDALNALGGRLEHKFAEIKALSEITERVNASVFFDEVLDHVFESFEKAIPYDRISILEIFVG